MAEERVLIVDDSSQNTKFLADYVLIPNGYQVLVAHDGRSGVDMALDKKPDLMLLDLNLPKLTGMEVLEKLNAKGAKIPVIMMTFHGSETLAVQAFRMGIKDYILKPFTISEMLEAIEHALTEVRLRKERDDLTQRLLKSNRELEKRVKELNTLFGIGKSVTALLNQNKLLSRLVEAAIYLTNAEEGSLLLLDHKTDELYMVAARGFDERVVRSFRLKVNDSLAGQVVTTGQPVMLTSQDLTKIQTAYLVRSLMYVPLKIKEHIIGVLSVDNRHHQRDFTNHDLRLLSALADYSAISLENARLFSQAEHERTKLATVLSEIEEPVILVTGANHRVAVANAAFCRSFGLAAESVEGQPLAGLLQNKSLLEFLEAAPDTATSHKSEIPLDNGQTFYATLTLIPGVGQAVIMQDVTHFKELDRMKSDFVSTVSHDLRTPLTSIKEYAQMTRTAGPLNERQQMILDRISTGTQQVINLIDNLLDLSSIELGVDPNISVVDVSQLATQIVADFQHQAGRRQQQLICHTSAAQPAQVVGSRIRLRQVISNLIDNALRYTPKRGQVSVLVQIQEKQVVCKIEDNGPGIPPADLPFVFDKFFRVRQGSQAELNGTGLGLAICKSIVERYNGHIWAESRLQHGSQFIFTLPLASADQLNSIELRPTTIEPVAA